MKQNKKEILLGSISDKLVETLKLYNAVIAGGAITSVFTEKEINDYDIYFKNDEDLKGFLRSEWCNTHYRISSKKALNFVDWDNSNKLIQVIVINTYPTPEDIWKDFDFTVCMGAYDFEEGKFFLHKDFIYDNMSKTLNFNNNTAFPMVSLKRVDKYKSKGYSINLSNLYKIAFAIQSLEINNLNDVLDNLGGMYGDELDEIFEDILDEDFDINKALDCLDKIEKIEFRDKLSTLGIPYNIIVSSRCGDEIYYDKNSSIIFNKSFDMIKCVKEPEFSKMVKILNAKESKFEEILEFPMKFVKYVEVKDNKYFSFYDKNFEYKEGEVYNDVYVSTIDYLAISTYSDFANRAFVYGHIDNVDDIAHPDFLEGAFSARSCIMLDRFVVDKIIPIENGKMYPDEFKKDQSMFGNWDFTNKESKDSTETIFIDCYGQEFSKKSYTKMFDIIEVNETTENMLGDK